MISIALIFVSMDSIDSETDVSENIDSEDMTDTTLISKLINHIPRISDINKSAFTPNDLRGGSVSKHIRQIPDHIYALHITYLQWKKYRKLNDSIPLIIREAVSNLKPQIGDDRRLIGSFVQKRLTEYSLKVGNLNK